MSQEFAWVLAGLPMATDPENRPASGWWLETYADGADLGSAEGVISVRESLLLDGDDERIDHWSNRTMQWTTAVCGYTMADLADGEAALSSRTGGPADLVMTPPGDGFPTLFDVRTSQMRAVINDLDWIGEGVKYQAYALTIKAAPWGLSTTIQTETFATGAGTVTTVDNASSATNWPGMVTDTYLGQSTVALGPIAAVSTGTAWSDPAIGQDFTTRGSSWACSGTIRYSAVVPAVTYTWVDLAIESTGSGLVLPGILSGVRPRMAGTDTGDPVAVQPQASGFTRYFWRRPSGTGFQLNVTVPAIQGQTSTFHVDGYGTSTTLPSGSLLALSTKGSVRSRPQMQISHPSPASNSLGEVLAYVDPTMLQNGWQPDNDATWPSAPEGTYWLYVQPNVASYSAGDVFGVTVGGITETTRVDGWAGVATPSQGPWFPIGPFALGTNRSRQLGTVSGLLDEIELTRDGTPLAFDSPARLIREDPDAVLIHVRGLTVVSGVEKSRLFIDPSTFDQPRPGIFAGEAADGSDAVSVLSTAESPVWPIIVPPVTALWIQASGTTTPEVTVVHRPPFHTFAAA